MAQPYCTGPVAIFAGVGTRSAPIFFGHSKAGLKIHNLREYEPFMNDLGGTRKPFDQQYMGCDAIITGVVNRCKNDVLAKMRALSRVAANEGMDKFGELGGFMVYEGFAVTLWLRFPYGDKAAFQNTTNGALPKGRRYIATFLETDEEEIGTRSRDLPLAWYAQRVFDPTTGNFVLYDTNITGLPAVT